MGPRALRIGTSAACAAVGIAVLHELLNDILIIYLHFLQYMQAALRATDY